MGYVLAMRLSIRAAVSFACLVASALTTRQARAEGRFCEWGPEGTYAMRSSLICRADEACSSTCSTRGQSDLVCAAGLCTPPCTTIRLCSEAADCARDESCVTLEGPRPRILDDAYEPTGVCTSNLDRTGNRVPPSDSLCEPTWAAWEDSYLYRATTPIGVVTLHAASWSHADRDFDGCLNGSETSVCGGDGGPCSTEEVPPPVTCPPPARSPSCCQFSVGGLACSDDAATCACSTVHTCTPGPRPYPNRECVSMTGSGAPGLCIRPPDTGALGVCLFEEFFVGCADPRGVTLDACLRRPGSGELTENFYAGDCDSDGCPNGQDADRCTPCDDAACASMSVDPREGCEEIVNAGLEDPDACFPAGDAGVPSVDASTGPGPDGSVAAEDAARPTHDAALDASTERPPTFGGSGVSCHAGTRSGRGPLGLGLLGLAVAARARRRRALTSS